MFRSFGYITVAVAGTPVRCTTNEANPSASAKIQSVSVFAKSTNSGTNMYLGGAGMDKSTGFNVYAIIAKGTFISGIEQLAYNPVAVEKLYIDADTSGDAALVSGLEC